MTPPVPHLRDPLGRLVIGPAQTPYQQDLCAAQGATSVLFGRDGKFRGVYVDNETGNVKLGSREQLAQRDAVARVMVAHGFKVVVGLYPFEAGKRIPGATCALQWYPYGQGFAKSALPKAEAYITQFHFAHPGCKPPTKAQRYRLYMRAMAKRPKLVWVY